MRDASLRPPEATLTTYGSGVKPAVRFTVPYAGLRLQFWAAATPAVARAATAAPAAKIRAIGDM